VRRLIDTQHKTPKKPELGINASGAKSPYGIASAIAPGIGAKCDGSPGQRSLRTANEKRVKLAVQFTWRRLKTIPEKVDPLLGDSLDASQGQLPSLPSVSTSRLIRALVEDHLLSSG
jgi:hypothetical protein